MFTRQEPYGTSFFGFKQMFVCSFLRCRQFVEMVNGTDSEVCCLTVRSPKSQDSYPGSPILSPRHGGSNTHLHTGGTRAHPQLIPFQWNVSPVIVSMKTCVCVFPPGSDSPTCSNGVTPTNKSKNHAGAGSSSVKYPSASSSASSSTSSSPSSVNYSESNSSDSTKSQPHSANSNQETR